MRRMCATASIPPMADEARSQGHIEALRRMFADLPASNERRLAGRGEEAASLPEAEGLPDYYARNFHYQTDGYLSEHVGAALRYPGRYTVHRRVRGDAPAGACRRSRHTCAARISVSSPCSMSPAAPGRFLEQAAQAFPAMPMTGVDLSAAYIETARDKLADRRNISPASKAMPKHCRCRMPARTS